MYHHHQHRPLPSSSSPSSSALSGLTPQSKSSEPPHSNKPRPLINPSAQTCANCETQTTPLWRRDETGATLCNACALFQKMKGRPRPISLKTDTIKQRNRVKAIDRTDSVHSKHCRPSVVGSQGVSSSSPRRRTSAGSAARRPLPRAQQEAALLVKPNTYLSNRPRPGPALIGHLSTALCHPPDSLPCHSPLGTGPLPASSGRLLDRQLPPSTVRLPPPIALSASHTLPPSLSSLSRSSSKRNPRKSQPGGSEDEHAHFEPCAPHDPTPSKRRRDRLESSADHPPSQQTSSPLNNSPTSTGAFSATSSPSHSSSLGGHHFPRSFQPSTPVDTPTTLRIARSYDSRPHPSNDAERGHYPSALRPTKSLVNTSRTLVKGDLFLDLSNRQLHPHRNLTSPHSPPLSSIDMNANDPGSLPPRLFLTIPPVCRSVSADCNILRSNTESGRPEEVLNNSVDRTERGRERVRLPPLSHLMSRVDSLPPIGADPLRLLSSPIIEQGAPKALSGPPSSFEESAREARQSSPNLLTTRFNHAKNCRPISPCYQPSEDDVITSPAITLSPSEYQQPGFILPRNQSEQSNGVRYHHHNLDYIINHKKTALKQLQSQEGAEENDDDELERTDDGKQHQSRCSSFSPRETELSRSTSTSSSVVVEPEIDELMVTLKDVDTKDERQGELQGLSELDQLKNKVAELEIIKGMMKNRIEELETSE